MPAQVSDIHEISVLVGFIDKDIISKSVDEKYKSFIGTVAKYGEGKISVSKKDFEKNINLFDRGIELSNVLKSDYGLVGKNLSWSGVENHKEDSSDIYVDGMGVSLKDSSKIIRNSGFEQLLETFCEKPIKKFKEPFWEFAPKLSASYLITVIADCYSRGFVKLSKGKVIIDGKERAVFSGDISSLKSLNLKEISEIFKKADLKVMVKDFSKNGDLKELFKIREALVKDVSKKVTSNLMEGLIQNPSHFASKIKYMLQYRETEKLFGFSSSKEVFAGKIKSEKDVSVLGKAVFTEPSQLTDKTTGLQINIYTDIEIDISNKKESVRLQNQLRYKHRTFSCAPEANFHLLNYSDWKKLYPSN
ncbi:MAG: hypothetical protein H6622_10975 [Halobacteriovoraceae bacterium]|nr:hypothetical protein [Halobacteriovoraceae bacterium]